MNLTDTIQSVTRRAKKLMQMSEGRGCTEAEAAVAAEKLQALLQEYNLSMAQLSPEDEGHPSSSDEDRVKAQTQVPAIHEYQRGLMRSLAANNFCIHRVRSFVGGDRHVLVGRQVNVDVTLLSYEYLEKTLQRLASEGGFTAKRDREYFLEGAVSRLVDRLWVRRGEAQAASKRELKQASGSDRALVCLEDVYGSEEDRNNDVLNDYPLGTTAQRRRDEEYKQHQRAEQQKRYEAAGVPSEMAMYMANGYSPEQAASFTMDRPKAPKGRTRYRSTGWTREDRRYAQKVNSRAYQAGVRAGAEVGLDPQVHENQRKRIA